MEHLILFYVPSKDEYRIHGVGGGDNPVERPNLVVKREGCADDAQFLEKARKIFDGYVLAVKKIFNRTDLVIIDEEYA